MCVLSLHNGVALFFVESIVSVEGCVPCTNADDGTLYGFGDNQGECTIPLDLLGIPLPGRVNAWSIQVRPVGTAVICNVVMRPGAGPQDVAGPVDEAAGCSQRVVRLVPSSTILRDNVY